MEFGRVSNPDVIDFTMPPDHADTASVLGGKKAKHPQVYVGCPIWGDKRWVGSLYPADAKEKDFLLFYGKQFNAIELNATHYRVPPPSGIIKWKDSVPKDFRFCPKVPQTISHAREIHTLIPLMQDFLENINLLGENLGTIFLQLPPHGKTDRLPSLLKFLDSLPAGTRLAIELRHESWFEGNAAEPLFSYLKEHGLGTVITDVSGRRDVLHQRLTDKTAFIRFTANNLHPTDFVRMDDWAKRLTKWLDEGLEILYFFVHTPDKYLCLELGDYFIGKINKLAGLSLKPPKSYDTNPQNKLF